MSKVAIIMIEPMIVEIPDGSSEEETEALITETVKTNEPVIDDIVYEEEKEEESETE